MIYRSFTRSLTSMLGVNADFIGSVKISTWRTARGCLGAEWVFIKGASKEKTS